MTRLLLCLLPALLACEPNETHPIDTNAFEAGTTAPLSCVPNLDGIIDASELTAVLNVPVKYLVNPTGVTRTVDLTGTTGSNNQITWDWGASYADDEVATIQASALTGKWYAGSFPNGQFATPYDPGDTLEAVYSQDSNGLYIQGIASAQESPSQGKTLLVYGTPVKLYVFPLQVGTTWTSSGTVTNGFVQGLQYSGTDTYAGADVATGQLILPDNTFTQAHRLTFVVTSVPSAGATLVTRQTSFLFECFGEIARATSQPNETSDDFTTAADVRRFGM